MQSNAMDLRKGFLVKHQARTCTVIHWNILRNDRRTFVQMKLKDLETGRITELKEHGDSKYEVLDSEVVELAHSYRDGEDDVFYTPAGVEYRCLHAATRSSSAWESRPTGLPVGHLVTVDAVICRDQDYRRRRSRAAADRHGTCSRTAPRVRRPDRRDRRRPGST
jgi:translation elongation factor P/translation initiation factor 5A